VAGTAAPHELQKRAPASQDFPQALQKNPVPEMACGGAAGCAVTATWRCCPEESAQTNAIIHPIKVQPASRFKAKIAVKSDLLRARKAGRK